MTSKIVQFMIIGLMISATAFAGGNLYWRDGSSAWTGSRGYHQNGSSAWTGSRGYCANGSSAWTGSRGYHCGGSSAWTGSRCYYEDGSSAGSGSCSWSWGPGVYFTIVKAENGIASCTLTVGSGVVGVPCD